MPQLTSRPLVGRSREAASRSHRYNSSDETDRIQNNGRIKVNVSRAYDKSESTERMRNTGSASQASPGRGAAMSQTERNDEVALMLSHPAHAALDKHRSRVDKFNFSQRSGLSHKLDGSHRSLYSASSFYSHRSASSALSGKSASSRRRRHRWFPRVDLWLLLSTTQIVSLGTLASSSSSYSQRTSTEEGVLAIASMTFILSLGVGAGMLHRPFRRYLTSLAPPPVYDKEDRPRRRVKGIREMVTPEQLLSLLALVLTCVTSGMMLQPSSELAVAGSEVWNPNLFYSSWIGLYGSAYLVATLSVGSLGSAGVQLRRWFLLLFSSICAASSLLVVSSGTACEGTLGETGYCKRSTTGGLLSVATASVALACGTFLARAARRTQGYTHGSASTTSRTRVISLISSSILLVLQMTTVGLATSPSGPGYDIGSIFLTTWTTLVLTLLLWKGSIDAFLITPTPAVATLKTLEKRHRRSLHSSGMSHDTGSTDDEESQEEPVVVLDDLRSYRFSAMGDSKSRDASVYEASRDDSSYGSESTPSQGEVIRCLESLGERRGAAYDRPDPEEGSYEKKVSDPDSTSIPASYVKRGSDPDTDPEEGYDAKYDTTYEYEAPESGTRSRTGSETDYSGYYSGSQAVQVRTGNQEDVSTLGGTLDALSRAMSYGDLTKSRNSTPARSRSRSRSRSRPKAREAEAPLQREKSRRFADPFAEESKRKMSNFTMSSKSSELVDQEWEFDDYGAPQPQPQRSERQERHHQEHRAQQSPLMSKPTLVPTAMNDGPHHSPAALAAAAIAAAELRQQQAQAPPLGTQAQHALAQQQQAQQGQPAPQGLSRRASKSSLMSVLSNLSPLEEGTEEEGSSRPRTVTGKSVAESTISTKSRISVPSGKERRLRRQKSGEGRDRDPKREIKAASKGRSRTQPPPPPRQTTKGGSKQKKPSRRSPVVDDRPSGKKSPTASLEEKKPSEGSSTLPRTIEPEPKKPSEGSSTVPRTVDGQVGLKKASDGSSDIRTIPPTLGDRPVRRRSNTDDSGSLSTSSSDFDIVVPSTQSVVTELTQEGFDVPETIPEARKGSSKGNKGKYASHAAEAADNYNSFHKSGNTARKSPRSKKSPRTAKAKKAQAKAALPEGLPGKMPLYNGTPSVSEHSNATRSPNTASNSLRGQEVHPSVEAFLATAMKQARMSRSYGNVQEDDIPLTDEEEDSEVVRAARREARGQSQRSGGDDRRKKRPSPATSKPTKKSASKSPRGQKSAAYSRSEPELLRDEALLDAASDDEKYRSKSPDAVLEGMLAEQATPAGRADVGRDGLTEQERRESMQSFFSEADEDGTFLTSPGEDYVC